MSLKVYKITGNLGCEKGSAHFYNFIIFNFLLAYSE